MWDLIPWPATEPRHPALGGKSLSHWNTGKFWSALLIASHQVMMWCQLVPPMVFASTAFLIWCLLGLSLGGSVVKNLPVMQETWVQFLGQEDLQKEGIGTHSSVLAWRIPLTEEPGSLQSIGLQRVGHNWSDWAHLQAYLLKSYIFPFVINE